MAETSVIEPGFAYRIISLVSSSPVGIDKPGPGPDQPLHLNAYYSEWTVAKTATGYLLSIAGYPYVGVEQRVPGVPVDVTDDVRKKVEWLVVFVPDRNAYTIHAAFNNEILWTVENASDPKSQIVNDPRQAGPPLTQLFKFVRAF